MSQSSNYKFFLHIIKTSNEGVFMAPQIIHMMVELKFYMPQVTLSLQVKLDVCLYVTITLVA